MGCGHGYHGHGCWGPGDYCGPRWSWGEYEPGYGPGPGPGMSQGYGYGYGPGAGYRRRTAGRYGTVSRGAAAAQLGAYLATLRDEVRAVEADLAEMTGGETETNPAPQL